MTEDEHDAGKGDKGNEKIGSAREDGGDDEDALRNVDLADEGCIAEQAARRPRCGLREEVPQHEGRQEVDREVLDRKSEDVREDEGQDDHQQERVEHRPEDPERGAFVPNLEIACDEVAQQAAIADDFHEGSDHRGPGLAKGRWEGNYPMQGGRGARMMTERNPAGSAVTPGIVTMS